MNRKNAKFYNTVLIVPPLQLFRQISLLLKFIPAFLIVSHCGSDIRGSDIGRKEF